MKAKAQTKRSKRCQTPPTVKTEKASEVAQTTAKLNASVNPNGGEVTECKLEYGPTTSYGESKSCTPSPGVWGKLGRRVGVHQRADREHHLPLPRRRQERRR